MLARLAGAIEPSGAPEVAGPVARRIERMRALAAEWSRRGTRVAWLAWQPPEPLEAVLQAELASRLPAARLAWLEPDWAAIGLGSPLLRAAWPERFEGLVRPLRERRQHWRRAPAGPRPQILHAADREREAQLGAEWVHARLAGAQAAGVPTPRLAIVAIDRWLARRVRALLERAGVLIDDREGWLLSTTVAASAAMGWLDAVGGDGYYDDLLGWLDSRFVRPPGARELRAWIERRATRHRYLRGWRGLRGAPEEPAPEGVATLLALAAQQHRAQPLQGHLDRLEEAMRWAGSPRRLAADAAGRQLLGLLDALRRGAAAGDAEPLSFPEFRALLATILERHRFYGAIDSPVEMLTPIDAAGRHFDAVLVLGAAQGALPSPPPPLPLVNEPLREMLGLPTAAAQAASQQRDLALILSLASASAITCRTDPADGARPSPWVERLESVSEDRPLHARIDLPGQARRLVPLTAAQPAVALRGLPPRLSVGSVERLVACPFRFLVLDGWRLREAPQAVDVPGVRERGELAHEILERFHVQARERGIAFDDSELDAARSLLLEVTETVAARESAAGGGTLGELAEWRATLGAYLDWAHRDAKAGWRWVAGEREGGVSIRWNGPDGHREVRIEGRLDRLDAGPQGSRVVDYKLGSPERLRRIAADPGRAAQLALYAWIAAADGPVAQSGYLSLRRGGVDWIALADPTQAVIDGWADALPRYLARVDAGEPLVAWGSECAHCASRGVCRKGHWS
jgi:ATP-dependent helicase/nuclease subunit B